LIYLDVVFDKKKMNHQMKSYRLNKVSLSPFDDKHYILSDGISNYAYGHREISSPIPLRLPPSLRSVGKADSNSGQGLGAACH